MLPARRLEVLVEPQELQDVDHMSVLVSGEQTRDILRGSSYCPGMECCVIAYQVKYSIRILIPGENWHTIWVLCLIGICSPSQEIEIS